MLARAFPNKMPRVLWIDADDAAPVRVSGPKCAGESPCEIRLAISHGVGIVARARRHEANTVNASIFGIAETVDGGWAAAAGFFKVSFDRRIRKAVARVGRGLIQSELDEIVGVDNLR